MVTLLQGRIIVVVYLDLLLFINFIFNIVLVTIAGWMGLQQFRIGRYCFAALVGTIFWLIFFFWPQYIFIDWICRIAGGVAMAYVAWHPLSLKALFTRTILLVVSGQLMGGGIFSLAFALGSTPLGNSVPTISLAIVAGGGTIMLGIAAWWTGRIHRTRQLSSYMGEVTVCFQGKTLIIPALLDSGNTLRHPVNSWPVVIIERQVALRLFDPELFEWLDEPLTLPPDGMETKIGFIPFKSVGGSGILAAVKPSKLIVSCEGVSKTLTQVYIAVRQKQQHPLEHQALAFPLDNWKEGEIV